ncbi:unnamed protein product [Cladocopium goreaui]|uniref:Ketoreductase (KR) domain-containing protein n=1 Tax=Cladocopium goreaui TaxID=2562237 RepID=A0A9P1GHB2_9DINO|nr:unnamed protein product [Cladocopium goreaui]
MLPKEVWLVARLASRLDELARSLRAAFSLGASCRVILIDGDSHNLLHLHEVDFATAISEEEILEIIRKMVSASQASDGLSTAIQRLVEESGTDGSASVLFLDEAAEEDWSWTAPQPAGPAAVCLGVHEDFEAEVLAIRRAVAAVGSVRSAQLGPVALHSSACLHLLSSVRHGAALPPLPAVRPVNVQHSSAPRFTSARHVRRALPRRQPLRFLWRLESHPLESASSRAEVHQAIVAACLVSKSVYDERDTKLLLAWHESSGTVDRSLLGLSKVKLIPSESQVLDALQLKMSRGTESLENGLQDLMEDVGRCCFAAPVVVQVTPSPNCWEWPEWKTQASWPTDPPIFLCINWPDALPGLGMATSLCTPVGSVAKIILTLQHWHNLGVLPATLTPRPSLPTRGEKELAEDLINLSPQPGKDVLLPTLVPFKCRVIGRVRMGHVLFAECGNAKVMCKEQRLGAAFHVVVNELRVGDTLYCIGYPGFEYNCEAVIFAHQILFIEPSNLPTNEEEVLFQDEDLLVLAKPAGKLAWEDSRHRHERGTALKVEADQLLLAPEVDVSGPAVYAMKPSVRTVGGTVDYAVLVAGVPAVSTVSAALRPARGKLKEDAETQLEVLWQSEDCSLLRATVKTTEVKSQVCRHLHILGCPVWGDRRYGNRRANLRARAIFGLARPWCHLMRLELFGGWGGIICESSPPQELMRVLSAVGCRWRFPEAAVRVVPPMLDFRTLEHGLSLAYYVVPPCVGLCTDGGHLQELGTFLEGFEKIFVIASGSGSPRAIEVMAAALRVMKAQSKVTELWFVVEGTQAAQVEDLSKSSIPYHAGLWGLARCARREQREHFVGCLEVGCSSGRAACAAGIWRRLRIASASQEDGREHELLVRRSMQGAEESGSDEEDVERHVARLEQTTPKAFGVWPPPIFPSHSWFAISGGCGALGLATGAWLVNQGVQHVALLSRSGKCQDGEAAKDLQELYSGNVRVLMQRCDVSSQDAVKSAAEAMKALDGIPVKGQ